jgi:uncharacterized membrane protein
METIRKSIIINAPVENVYNYLADHANEPEWIPSMIEVKDYTGPNVGDHFKWKYKMAGIVLEGKTNIVQRVPNKKMVSVSEGGANSTWTFIMGPSSNGTLLELTIEYQVPIPVIGKIAEKVVLKRNDRETQLAMENIKEILEG